MSGTTWTKFFWADWLSDRGLRRSSYAARGLWMDMLCIAAQGDPIGKLCIEGDPLSAADIARMTGGDASEVETLLVELERNGVFSRDRNGVVYSRRMMEDAKKAATARKNGKKGGNPTLGKQTRNSASDKGKDNGPDNGRDKPHKPYASTQSSSLRSDDKGAPVARDPTPSDYLSAVVDAERTKAVIEHRKVTCKKPLTPRAAKLLADELAKCPDPNAAADEMVAAGWQGFKAEWIANRTASRQRQHGLFNGANQTATSDPDEWRKRCERYFGKGRFADREPGKWSDAVSWGPPPDHPETIVPPEILREFGIDKGVRH